jgi:triacylglycerol lipase
VDIEIRVVRDLAYGNDERHRFDVHHRPAWSEGDARPVLVFLHGGGFVSGDKGRPGNPQHDNIGRFAVESGLVGVTMNYRLAPAVTYPSGSEDVLSAVRFLVGHVAQYGGDPRQIVLMGHAAGAAHVAKFLATQALRDAAPGVVAAILSSGIFDPGGPAHRVFAAYYGSNQTERASASSIGGLLESDVPLLVRVAEFDPPELQDQTATLLAAAVHTTGRLPAILFGNAHENSSVITHPGTEDRTMGDGIVEFIRSVTQFDDRTPYAAPVEKIPTPDLRP